MKKKLALPDSSLPRERLVEFGSEALSDQELLAILLRTGSQAENVMELAARVLREYPDLYALKSASIEEFTKIRGIGQVKAIELKAMTELGYRVYKARQPKIGRVRSSVDLAFQLMEELKDYQQEHLLCLYLNTKNEIIHKKTLFVGSLNQSINKLKCEKKFKI